MRTRNSSLVHTKHELFNFLSFLFTTTAYKILFAMYIFNKLLTNYPLLTELLLCYLVWQVPFTCTWYSWTCISTYLGWKHYAMLRFLKPMSYFWVGTFGAMWWSYSTLVTLFNNWANFWSSKSTIGFKPNRFVNLNLWVDGQHMNYQSNYTNFWIFSLSDSRVTTLTWRSLVCIRWC